MVNIDLIWTERAAEAAAAVESFAGAEPVLHLFAGAAFALHQDTLRAFAIDMARADDEAQAAAIDAAQPTPLGPYAERVKRALDALLAIENANRTLLTEPVPPSLTGDRAQLYRLLAKMRLTAARLWLLTLQARAIGEGGAPLRLGVTGIWSRLGSIPASVMPDQATAFTGTYFEGVVSDPMDYAVWPLNP